MKSIHFLAVALLSFFLQSCGKAPSSGGPAADAGGKPVVAVANYPLKYFTQRIAGDHADVRYPAPADEDPAFWQPDDNAISAYQSADLIIMNGATYSKWALKASLPESKLVDTSSGFKDAFIEIKDDVTHSHGPGGEHSHSGTAFTTWIDFQQAIKQARAVCDALERKWPAHKEDFEKNFDGLKQDMEKLDARMAAVGKRVNSQPMAASHPVYHYWARRYGINLKSVLWEPEEVPDEKQMADLGAILAAHPAKWMVWEGEPAKESVEKLKAGGLQSVVFDPCGNTPDSGDFMTVMDSNLKGLEAAFP